MVAGAAGIGKSRLLEVLNQRAAERRLGVLAARGGDLGRGFPFGIVRQLLAPAVEAGSAAFDGPAVYARAVSQLPSDDGGGGSREPPEAVPYQRKQTGGKR